MFGKNNGVMVKKTRVTHQALKVKAHMNQSFFFFPSGIAYAIEMFTKLEDCSPCQM